MERIIVTGACGFLGKAIVIALKQNGHNVEALDITPECPIEDVIYHQADILNRDKLINICEGADSIIHSAALIHTLKGKDEQLWQVNVRGTRNLLDAALACGVKRFIYISSASVVYQGKDIKDGTEDLPYAKKIHSSYEETKITAEKMVLQENGSGGMVTCALRPHMVFGPGDTRFVPAIIEKGRAGKLKARIGRGPWYSDFTYIDNFTRGVLLAEKSLQKDGLLSPAAGQAYFLTNGQPYCFWDLVSEIGFLKDFSSGSITIPVFFAFFIASIREFFYKLKSGVPPVDGITPFAIRYMTTHHYFSIKKAQRDLTYNPEITMKQAIKLTCSFYN